MMYPLTRALIFDMDGVITDNLDYHLAAWLEFCRRYGFSITADEFRTKMFGGTNKDLMARVFGRQLDKNELLEKATEKEKIYRDIHKPHIKPLDGLREFLVEARDAGFKMAIATAAPRENLEFVLENTGFRQFFDVTLDESHVTRGKPDPEVYLKTAELLGIPASSCIVFEDSKTGIKAAIAAGMKVIGVATSIDKKDLDETWKAISDFTEISVADLY